MYLVNSFLIILAFLSVFIEFFHPIQAINQDLGRHVKLGEIILKTSSVPTTNLFSYTFQNFHYINTHWLSELIFYIIFSKVGFHGILIFTSLIVLFTFFILTSYLRFKNISIFALAITYILYIGILFERTEVRPEIFSFLFLTLFVTILYKNKEKQTKLIFLLPFIELIWVNTHIYFIMGILVTILFLLDELLVENPKKLLFFINNKYSVPKHTSLLILIFVCIILVTFINPDSFSRVIYPFNIFNNYSYSIQENQNIFTLQQITPRLPIILFEITTVLLFCILIMNRKKSKSVDWMLVICFAIIAASADRNLPLFVFATFIPFAMNLSAILTNISKKGIKLENIHKSIIKFIGYVCIVLFLLLEIKSFISTSGIGWEEPKSFESSVDFFITEKLHGHIYNNFDIGSFLIYKMYPKEKVFVDGRPEAYPANFNQTIDMPIQNDPQLFQKAMKRYHFNVIIFAHSYQIPWTAKFVNAIINNPDWKLVYLDGYAFIMVKNNEENKTVINRFAITEKIYKINESIRRDKTALMNLANFFDKVKWREQEIRTLQDIIMLDPYNCEVLYNLAVLTQNISSSPNYVLNYQEKCNNHSRVTDSSGN